MTEQEKIGLYQKQKHMLETFLEKGAISKSQYEYSVTQLREKMQIQEEEENHEHAGA